MMMLPWTLWSSCCTSMVTFTPHWRPLICKIGYSCLLSLWNCCLLNSVNKFLSRFFHKVNIPHPIFFSFFNPCFNCVESCLIKLLWFNQHVNPVVLSFLQIFNQLLLVKQMLFILLKVLSAHIFHLLELLWVFSLQIISTGILVLSLINNIQLKVLTFFFDFSITVIFDSVNRFCDLLSGYLQLLCVVREVVRNYDVLLIKFNLKVIFGLINFFLQNFSIFCNFLWQRFLLSIRVLFELKQVLNILAVLVNNSFVFSNTLLHVNQSFLVLDFEIFKLVFVIAYSFSYLLMVLLDRVKKHNILVCQIFALLKQISNILFILPLSMLVTRVVKETVKTIPYLLKCKHPRFIKVFSTQVKLVCIMLTISLIDWVQFEVRLVSQRLFCFFISILVFVFVYLNECIYLLLKIIAPVIQSLKVWYPLLSVPVKRL